MMGARQSSATEKALRMVARGINMHQAAIRAGIAYTTIWRACQAKKALENTALSDPQK
jgi:DNA-binding phage protein